MPDQEFLASYAVEIDEAGVSRLERILSDNRLLADRLSASFSAASESIRAFRESLSEDLPSLFSGSARVSENPFGPAAGLQIGLNLTEPRKEISAFTADVKKPIPLSANASAVVSAARTALESVRSLFSETFVLRVQAETEKQPSGPSRSASPDQGETPGPSAPGSAFLRMSTGGRFSSPTAVQVAEDGDAEYIIPVRKESRALPLLRQLLGELSPEARQSLTGEGKLDASGPSISLPEEITQPAPSFSLPEGMVAPLSSFSSGPDLSELVSLLSSSVRPAPAPASDARPVSAPVTINVNARGSDAERIGRSIYDTAERCLLRTLGQA